MGSSCCKASRSRLPSTDTVGDGSNAAARRSGGLFARFRRRTAGGVPHVGGNPQFNFESAFWEENAEDLLKAPEAEEFVARLVKLSLNAMRTLVNNEEEPPIAVALLHKIGDKQRGWPLIILTMVKFIPLSDPLGPAMIMLIIDDCPLPTKESIAMLSDSLKLSVASKRHQHDVAYHRNVCVALACIAGNLAGPNSVALLTSETLEYLLANIRSENTSTPIVVFSLVALEKFAQTSENKVTIEKRLSAEIENPLLRLESWVNETDWEKRQAGFCAQWLLDNLFISKGRQLTYERTDNTKLNAMLNSNDVSEYLKMSPNGLEARCDSSSFESVRCTFQVDRGVWYYEATLVTNGVMQIGWATKNSKFLNHEGYGIGDDQYSLAYDGCRQLIWHSASYTPHNHRSWQPGDVLGCLLDVDGKRAIFYLNGESLETNADIFMHYKSGFFAAASFMTFQQCIFNFGATPFSYPPDYSGWKSFNEAASLSDEDRIVLPRHVRMQRLREAKVREDSCTLCFDARASVRLMPCKHTGYCTRCATLLEVCPMCRRDIAERQEMPAVA